MKILAKLPNLLSGRFGTATVVISAAVVLVYTAYLYTMSAVVDLSSAIGTAVAHSVGAGTVWSWPVAGSAGSPPVIVRPFQPPAKRWQAGHRGVDLAAAAGSDVLAAGPGTVAFAGTLFGQGVVTVSHGAVRTSYEPVKATVHVGDVVAAGQKIGELESGTGHCRGSPCLHWGLLSGHGHGVRYYDPLLLLGLVRLRLEPVD